MKLYRADMEKCVPVSTEGEFGGTDTEGNTVFFNTHFRCIGAAWQHIESEITAMLTVYARQKEMIEQELNEIISKGAKASAKYLLYQENYEKAQNDT